jgi:methionyl-tRNA formyltransferase
MNITVFTSNQPRHLSLIADLASIAETVYAIIEVNTVFPGERSDFFKKSDVMQSYFSQVIKSEQKFFGSISFLPSNVRPIILKSGDLNKVAFPILEPALKSDEYVIFGSSFIKGELIDFLVNQNAYNIHMGVSPYYRGSSCNFWAAYEKNYDMVGATIHMLSKGLDSGDMLFHALPDFEKNPFDLGMRAVKSAHTGLVENLKTGKLSDFSRTAQDKSKELRYTKNSDFGDEVASDYLNNLPNKDDLQNSISNRNYEKFLNPFVY